MTPKAKFILRHLFMVSLPFIGIMLLFVLVDMLLFKESFGHAMRSSFVIWPMTIPIMEIVCLIRVQKKAKRLGFDLWPRTHKDKNLTHNLMVQDSKANLIEKLNQGNWKYKITDQKEVNAKTVLLLKHYQVPVEAALFIELEEKENGSTEVTFKAKSMKEYWFSMTFTSWTIQLKQFEYFQNIILDQEDQNMQLSFWN